ncbi:MAG: mercury(II) reductase [Deltaproteobacteria bacterium]|nr:mercury(II) reductase [Deltaproteobacteria bacterium]
MTCASCNLADTPPSGSDSIDLLVVGSGSAAFAAAIRATELGASVTLVERGTLGGTCVNVGCIPSKTLIRAAEARHRAGLRAFDGIRATIAPTDLAAVVAQKDALVHDLRRAKYEDVLAAHPSIRLVRGHARLRPDATVEIDGEPMRARRVLLCLGASAHVAAIPGLADTPFLTSTTAMELGRLPQHLVVLGGGFVALEIAQAFLRFGSRVTVVARSRLLRGEDPELVSLLSTYLRAEGLELAEDAAIERVDCQAGHFRVALRQEGASRTIEGDELLVATGRRPNTRGVGLEEAGIALGPSGEIVVDPFLRTSHPHVFAAGDVLGDPAFVYVAAYAGALAADNALADAGRTYDVGAVPRVTFTDPAIASVGLTEVDARARGHSVVVSRLPMSFVPRAVAARDTRGLVKLVADAGTNRLIGAHVLAPEAGDVIQEAVVAIRFGIRVDELAATFHPYLTSVEALKLACQGFQKDVTKLSCCAA